MLWELKSISCRCFFLVIESFYFMSVGIVVGMYLCWERYALYLCKSRRLVIM